MDTWAVGSLYRRLRPRVVWYKFFVSFGVAVKHERPLSIVEVWRLNLFLFLIPLLLAGKAKIDVFALKHAHVSEAEAAEALSCVSEHQEQI